MFSLLSYTNWQCLAVSYGTIAGMLLLLYRKLTRILPEFTDKQPIEMTITNVRYKQHIQVTDANNKYTWRTQTTDANIRYNMFLSCMVGLARSIIISIVAIIILLWLFVIPVSCVSCIVLGVSYIVFDVFSIALGVLHLNH